MTISTTEQLHTVKRGVRISDGTKVRFREDGREGIIDGLMKLGMGLGRNSDSRTQCRINIGDSDWTLALEDDLLVLTGCGWRSANGGAAGRVLSRGYPTPAGSVRR